MKRLIVYDLDGTLVDTGKDIAAAANYMLTHMAAQPLGCEEIRQLVGRGLHDLVKRCLQTEDFTTIERGARLFGDYYGAHLLDHSTLYPGAKDALDYFRTRTQSVITNKPNPFAVDLLKGLGVADYFTDIIAVGSGYPKKPDPTAVRSLLNREGISAQEALLVGDSVIDIETGRNAQVPTVIIAHGFEDRAAWVAVRPDTVVQNFEEFLALARQQGW